MATQPVMSHLDYVSMFRHMYTQFGMAKGQQLESSGISTDQQELEVYRDAPIFSSGVCNLLDASSTANGNPSAPFTQFGLLGMRSHEPLPVNTSISPIGMLSKPEDNLILANTNVPWSAFICGSQGAGKSHTLSCLLENALLDDNRIGQNPNRLTAMVFHYDNYTSAQSSQVCEAAYLCSSGIPVNVLVSPSNIWAMTKLYNNLPGLPLNAPRPNVVPLYLSETMLDISTILSLMALNPNTDSIPFYMETVVGILREIAMENQLSGSFSYTEFRRRLDEVKWAPGQAAPLNLRLQLLESFLEPSQFTRSNRPASAKDNIWSFEPGALTIVDLSDPFVSSSDACSLFSICISAFLSDRAQCGRVVALDEAHKSDAAKALTDDLTSIIRQQRHTGTRVLIATQEPTLSPDLIDLSNATFVHRFMSPAWYDVLRKHLAGANKLDSHKSSTILFETIVGLNTGEALLFCPTAVTEVATADDGEQQARRLGSAYVRVQIRDRLTMDGGRSILASDAEAAEERLVLPEIPMHIVRKPAVSNHRSAPQMATASASQSALTTNTQVSARVDSMTAHQVNHLRDTTSVAKDDNIQTATRHENKTSYGIFAVNDENGEDDSSYNNSEGDIDDSDIEDEDAAAAIFNQSLKAPSWTVGADDIRAMARSQMATRFHVARWHSIGAISWTKLTMEVEAALGLKLGRIASSKICMEILRDAALAELVSATVSIPNRFKLTDCG